MSTGISQELADAKNRAWRPLKFWLQSKTADELAAADPAKVASSYAPLEDWEIADCIRMRIATLQLCQKAGKSPPELI